MGGGMPGEAQGPAVGAGFDVASAMSAMMSSFGGASNTGHVGNINGRMEAFMSAFSAHKEKLATGALCEKSAEFQSFEGSTAGPGNNAFADVCNDFKRGNCSRGERCRFSHGDIPTGAMADDGQAPEGNAAGSNGVEGIYTGKIDAPQGAALRSMGGAASMRKGLDNLPEPWMDVEVADFVKKHNLDARIKSRLVDAMMRRLDTFTEDLKALDEVVQTARNPSGLCCVKLREMEEGTFTAKGKGDDKGKGDGKGKGGKGSMTDTRKKELFGDESPSRRRSRSRRGGDRGGDRRDSGRDRGRDRSRSRSRRAERRDDRRDDRGKDDRRDSGRDRDRR